MLNAFALETQCNGNAENAGVLTRDNPPQMKVINTVPASLKSKS